MQPFIKAPTYLMEEGEFRGLPRATRFIYLELSKCARELGTGRIVLTAGASDVAGVRDLIGGNVREIVRALSELQRPVGGVSSGGRREVGGVSSGGQPPVIIEGPRDRRVLILTRFAEEQRVDTSAVRTRNWREKQRQSSRPAPDGDVTGDVTQGHGDKRDASPGDIASVTVTPTEREREEEKEREEDPPYPPGGEGDGRVTEERPSGVQRSPLPESEVRLWGKLWLEEYTAAVRRVSGDAAWTMPDKQLRAIVRVVDARCDDRSRVPDFLRAEVPPFVEATRARSELWGGFSPEGWARWLNAGRPVVGRPVAVRHDRIVQQPPPGGPAWTEGGAAAKYLKDPA